VKSKKSKVIYEALRQGVFKYFGFPRLWFSDNENALTSDHMIQLFQLNGAERLKILPREPQGNGKVERIMGFLNKRIELLPDSKLQHWSDYIADWQLSINTAFFRMTESSRAHSLMGYHPRGGSVASYREILLHRHRSKLKDSTERWNKQNGAVVVGEVLFPGDLVLVEVRDRERYHDRWEGPQIVERVEGVNVVVKPNANSPPNTFMTVHGRRVKPYRTLEVITDEEVSVVRDLGQMLDDQEADQLQALAGEAAEEDSADELIVQGTRELLVESGNDIDLDLLRDEALRPYVENLLETDSSTRSRRNAPKMLTLDHGMATMVKEVTAHRRNADDGRWEFQVKWKSAPEENSSNCSEDMWLKAEVGTSFVEPFKQYLLELKERDDDVSEVVGQLSK
jgi:hypothetical protein